ncbi:hypothetical protein [Halorubellus litoreus]|uniref:Transglutaminase-like superfamily protein n=1 Tax=Halorubellus litoreus TaxID=755308 RepID=A0ABD5VFE3_9EURY
MTGEGDCEDYALVVLNMLMENTNRPLTLGFCGTGVKPKHVVVYDNHHVYSSGNVHEDTDLGEYLAESAYEWMIERRVR